MSVSHLLSDVYLLTLPFKNSEPGVMAHTCSPTTLEAEAAGLSVSPKLAWSMYQDPGPSGRLSESLSQNKQKGENC